MRTKNIILIVVAVLALLSSSAAILLPYVNSSAFAIRLNWGITIPVRAQYEEVFEKTSGESAHGDGIRYHVYAYEKDAPIKDCVQWTRTGQVDLIASYRVEGHDLLEQIDVGESEMPDWDHCKFYEQTQEDNSKILLCWDVNKQMLYAIEYFI